MTEVNIYLNGAGLRYVFNEKKDVFVEALRTQVAIRGYYTGVDEEGKYVIINPTICPAIEITEYQL